MSENEVPAADMLKPRLLFVEDEATLREHLAEKLSDEYDVDTAGNGNEALLAVMRAKPALVVTDIVMPDMDGVELLKTLREGHGTRSIPVLMISGRATDEYRIEGFEQGADGFLAKPYTERELRARIRSMLRSARSRADIVDGGKREQTEQRTSAERAELLENVPDGVFVLDGAWRFTYANQSALNFYNRKRTDLLGRSFWDVFATERGSELEARFKRAVRDMQPVSFETVGPPSGTWIEVNAHIASNALVVHFRDISRRKAVENDLLLALSKLQRHEHQLQEAEQRLTAGKHGLLALLAPLRAGLQTLRTQIPEEAASQQTLDALERQTSLLERWADDPGGALSD